MNFVSPLLMGAAQAADLPGDAVASFILKAADVAGLFDDSPDGPVGMMMSMLAGAAAALALAITLHLYFRSRYRSVRDIVTHGLAAAAVLGLLAFVAYDIRHAALAYLGINPAKPAVEFEIRLPKAAVSDLADSQVELHTDRNQTLAKVQRMMASDDDGRSVIRGSVPLDYNTHDRVVILDLPGQAQCEFMLRLAASPSRSGQYGPWHLADHVASLNGGGPQGHARNDGFAIRYRVL